MARRRSEWCLFKFRSQSRAAPCTSLRVVWFVTWESLFIISTTNSLSLSFLVYCLPSEHTEASYCSAQILVLLNRTQRWCLPLVLSLIPIPSTNYLGPFLLAKFTHGRPVTEERTWVAVSIWEETVFSFNWGEGLWNCSQDLWQVPPLGSRVGGGKAVAPAAFPLLAGHSWGTRKWTMDWASEQTILNKRKRKNERQDHRHMSMYLVGTEHHRGPLSNSEGERLKREYTPLSKL